jgi:membrane peptidoglycan carboxypeptidase
MADAAPPRIPRRLDPHKRRRIEEHLPRWWQARRQRKRARLLRMTRAQRVWRRVGLNVVWLLGFVAAIMVAAVVMFYTLSNVPRPDDLPVPQAALVQYSDGSTLARLGTNRIVVPLSKVPEPVRWAVLAAEDRNFYSEPGVSIKGTLRAALHDVVGGDTQGGSGITQQYVKNAYLSSSRTLSRKLRELAIAVKLSRQYSKDQILEWYLNTVYFGRGAYGIEAASEAYFGMSVDKLNLAQGALLAGLLRAPSYYDPAANPGPARDRWRYVMDGLVDTHHLAAAEEARTRFPRTQADRSGPVSDPSGLIAGAVKVELQQIGISEATINTRGLRIRTTIDRAAQSDAVNAIDRTFSGLTAKQRNMNNALVAEDPRTGAVIAYYGGPDGRDYAGRSDYFDYAGQGWRPPGSSFKPYTLAAALTQTLQGKKPGYTINTVVDGSQTRVIDGTTISNDPSDAQYSGHVTLAFAMKVSLNTAFDGLAHDIGPATVADLAHAAGIPKTYAGQPTLRSADGTTAFGIGIGDYPVRPFDQAVGFGTFAGRGMEHDGYLVQEVTDAAGHVLYQHHDASRRAMDARVANDVTLTLEPVPGFSGVALAGRPSAAKTGTEGILSGPDAGRNSDAWMVGFTPQVSTAVWVGSGDSTHAIYNAYGGNEYGRDLPGKAWKAFMDSYLAGQPALALPSTQQVFPPQDPGARPTATTATATATATAALPSSPTAPTATPTTAAATPTSSAAPSTSRPVLPPITTSPAPVSPTPTRPTRTRTTGSPTPTG